MVERSARNAPAGVGGIEATMASTTIPPLGQEHRSPAEMLKVGTGQAIDEAKQMVRQMAEEQRTKAAETVGGFAQALHRTAGNLEPESKEMAKYTQMAAERLDQMARYLKQTDWSNLVEGAESAARRQPYWFMGGAMAAGFLAARFLKSSPRRPRMERDVAGGML